MVILLGLRMYFRPAQFKVKHHENVFIFQMLWVPDYYGFNLATIIALKGTIYIYIFYSIMYSKKLKKSGL